MLDLLVQGGTAQAANADHCEAAEAEAEFQDGLVLAQPVPGSWEVATPLNAPESSVVIAQETQESKEGGSALVSASTSAVDSVGDINFALASQLLGFGFTLLLSPSVTNEKHGSSCSREDVLSSFPEIGHLKV